MNRFTIYCTEEQTRKALELGAPIIEHEGVTTADAPNGYYLNGNILTKIPTAEQMIGFLRSKGFRFIFNDVTNFWRIFGLFKIVSCGWNENKELAAIDAALEYLENIKQ